ncbi:hypothetical protein V1506DRAFT_541661 [Lipomyces tetrasporus]
MMGRDIKSSALHSAPCCEPHFLQVGGTIQRHRNDFDYGLSAVNIFAKQRIERMRMLPARLMGSFFFCLFSCCSYYQFRRTLVLCSTVVIIGVAVAVSPVGQNKSP